MLNWGLGSAESGRVIGVFRMLGGFVSCLIRSMDLKRPLRSFSFNGDLNLITEEDRNELELELDLTLNVNAFYLDFSSLIIMCK